MAEKKKAAKDEGTKGFRLPKSIAGAKLPKDARRKLGDLAKHPLVADILAAGLLALAAKLKKDRKVRKAASDAVDIAGETAKDAGGQLVETAAEALTAVAKPVVKRARKASSTTAPAKRRTTAAKPAAPKTAAAKPSAAKPAAKTKTEPAPAKPRATRRTTPKTSRAKSTKSE